MGKKADFLLKQLVEKDEEILRLRRKLNGGVAGRMRILVFRDGEIRYRTDLTIRTAWDGFGVETEDSREVVMNPFDILELKFGDIPPPATMEPVEADEEE